jgi:hypothetical protein
MRCSHVTISGLRTVGPETVATAFGGSRRAETASNSRKDTHRVNVLAIPFESERGRSTDYNAVRHGV